MARTHRSRTRAFGVVLLALGAAGPTDAQIASPLFLPPVVYDSGGSSPMSVAIGDLNGDDSPDIVVANAFSNSVAVLINNGDATFRPAAAYPAGGVVANAVATADVNADANVDVLVAIRGAEAVACKGLVGVFLGNGDGTLRDATTYASGGDVGWSVASADVNRDGSLDVLVVNEGSSTVGVLLGNGQGGFQPAALYESGGGSPRSIAVGDVNGDGNLDLAVANRCSGAVGCSSSGGIGVLQGNGDGTFEPAVSLGSGGDGPVSIRMSDVNGDARLDLVVANACPLDGVSCPTGNLGLLLGHGDGTFANPINYGATGLGTRSTAVADVNGDGRLDLLASSLCSPARCQEGVVDVFLAHAGSTFRFSGSYHTGAFGAASIAVADLNGDDGLDVVAANEWCGGAVCNGTVGVLVNRILAARIGVEHGGLVSRVNVRSNARLFVVLFASDDFEVSGVDPATVRFGPAGAHPVRVHRKDFDRDGRLDVAFHFVAKESGIACGDSTAALTGSTKEGARFRGMDAIVTVGCDR